MQKIVVQSADNSVAFIYYFPVEHTIAIDT